MNKENILLNAIIRDKILFRKFFLKDNKGNPLNAWYFQIPMILLDTVIACAGRKIGKTFCVIIPDILYHEVNYPMSSLLMMTTVEDHLEPIMEGVLDILRTIKFFSLFIPKGAKGWGKIKRKPFTYRLANKHIVLGRIAGIQAMYGKGDSLQLIGKHMDAIYIDEAEIWPSKAEKAVTQSHNTQGEAGEAYRKKYFGVPDGRIDTEFHKKDTSDELKDYRIKIASWFAPTYDMEQHKRNLQEYGGSINADMFKQQVRGEWGEPALSVFSIEDYLKCEAKENFYFRDKILDKITEFNEDDFADIILPKEYETILISVDYGGTMPLVFNAYIKMINDKRWWLIYCLQMKNMQGSEELQAKIVDYLVRFKFGARYIGIDATGPGVILVTLLRNKQLYPDSDYQNTLIEVNFNTTELVTYQEEDKIEGKIESEYSKVIREYRDTMGKDKVIKQYFGYVSEVCVAILQKMLKNQEFALPVNKRYIMSEFINHKAKKEPKRIKYFGNPDHILASFKVFAIMLHRLFADKNMEMLSKGILQSQAFVLPIKRYIKWGT